MSSANFLTVPTRTTSSKKLKGSYGLPVSQIWIFVPLPSWHNKTDKVYSYMYRNHLMWAVSYVHQPRSHRIRSGTVPGHAGQNVPATKRPLVKTSLTRTKRTRVLVRTYLHVSQNLVSWNCTAWMKYYGYNVYYNKYFMCHWDKLSQNLVSWNSTTWMKYYGWIMYTPVYTTISILCVIGTNLLFCESDTIIHELLILWQISMKTLFIIINSDYIFKLSTINCLSVKKKEKYDN